MFVTNQERATALGNFKNATQKSYYSEMIGLFKPMNTPENGDWLYSHKEAHQTYDNYKLPYYNQVTPERKTIYLQQFGDFNEQFIKKLCEFCEVFYPKMLVKCLPVLQFQKQLPQITWRDHHYGKQYLAQDILAYMQKKVPKDAYCVMGITLKDIYPGKNWNFVYGWAKYKARVGIFSFLRWDDAFAEGQTKQINWNLILYPSMRTMVHEIGHMFGITHCVYYRCLMNGFNNIQQNYINPMEFCPICFRKIIKNIDFNKKLRYEGLINFCKKQYAKDVKNDIKLYEKLLELCVKSQEKIPNSKIPVVVKPNTYLKPQIASNNRGKSLQVGVKRR